MEIVNLTPMTVGMIGGRVYFPNPSLTVVVKGTFDLRPGEAAEPAEEQIPPTGDEPYEDDDAPAPSLRYASDLGHFKPRADLLLVGKAHAPGGDPVPQLRVRFRVGGRERALTVFGDRWWEGGRIGSTATDPVPFQAMDLRYENAFGGVGFEPNPTGKGYSRVPSEWGYEVWPLPNVEDPASPVDSPNAIRSPAGFGPLDPTWEWRASKTGTYKGAWRKTRWPWFPTDFDWSYFNSAPPEMQVEGYLHGDEEVHLENLDPELSRLTSSLPGLRVRCFLSEDPAGDENSGEARDPSDPSGELRFREVPMQLDTLWVDAEERKLVLVWRGLADVRSEELDEIRHLFVMSEALDSAPLSEAACRRKLDEELARQAAEAEGMDVDAPPASEKPPDSDVPDLTAEEMDAEVDQSLEQMNQELVAAGAAPVGDADDPSSSPSPSPEAEEESEALLKEYGIELDEEWGGPSGPLTRDDVEARIQAGEPLSDQDLSGADLSGMDLTEADLHGSLLVKAVLHRTRLDRANLAEANLEQADLSGASLREVDLTDGDLTGAALAEADLSGAILRETILDEADLRASCLEGALCHDAMMPGADLSDVAAAGAVLQGADLTGGNLDRADFKGADLKEACLESVSAVGADLSGADLQEIQASEGADFFRASFRDAVAVESIWSGSRLVEADLAFCNLEGADFTEADLSRAELSGADLRFARLEKASLVEARMIECNLFEASLEKAVLDHADLTGASLYGAEVLDARFEETRLDRANLKMTKFQLR